MFTVLKNLRIVPKAIRDDIEANETKALDAVFT